MEKTGFAAGLAGFGLAVALAGPALGAMNADPDWPCIQRKVPQLSLGQVWTGPDLPAAAQGWRNDADVASLVEEVAPRRVAIPEAQQEIRDFAAALPESERDARLSMLMQGLFDHLNAERSQVISGIGRYARAQAERAIALRSEASQVDRLRAKADADQNEVALRSDRLIFQTRIFDERVKALTFVCEVPTLIEQRLYQLAKPISEALGGN